VLLSSIIEQIPINITKLFLREKFFEIILTIEKEANLIILVEKIPLFF
jgi:hypothetical protein